jgi:hypothetical protein
MRDNRHAQAQNDGVALKNHCKYQSLALNFTLEDTNWTVAFDFCRCHDGTNAGVADLFKTKFKAATNLETHVVCIHGLKQRSRKPTPPCSRCRANKT